LEARKKIYEKLEKLTPQSEYFNRDTFKNQDILRPELKANFNKVRTVLSNY